MGSGRAEVMSYADILHCDCFLVFELSRVGASSFELYVACREVLFNLEKIAQSSGLILCARASGNFACPQNSKWSPLVDIEVSTKSSGCFGFEISITHRRTDAKSAIYKIREQ